MLPACVCVCYKSEHIMVWICSQLLHLTLNLITWLRDLLQLQQRTEHYVDFRGKTGRRDTNNKRMESADLREKKTTHMECTCETCCCLQCPINTSLHHLHPITLNTNTQTERKMLCVSLSHTHTNNDRHEKGKKICSSSTLQSKVMSENVPKMWD